MRRRRPRPTDPIAFDAAHLRGLSARAATFARRHPTAARIAVTAALEAAAAQHAADQGDAAALPEALAPFVVRRPLGPDFLDAAAAAARLRVSRATVADWVATRRLLAWTIPGRGLVIPAAQIRGPGRIVPGLAAVLAVIGDPELAWAFLSEPWPFADAVARPIDRLRAGAVAAVVDAAPGFGTAVT